MICSCNCLSACCIHSVVMKFNSQRASMSTPSSRPCSPPPSQNQDMSICRTAPFLKELFFSACRQCIHRIPWIGGAGSASAPALPLSVQVQSRAFSFRPTSSAGCCDRYERLPCHNIAPKPKPQTPNPKPQIPNPEPEEPSGFLLFGLPACSTCLRQE
jgi:hypothetical protein